MFWVEIALIALAGVAVLVLVAPWRVDVHVVKPAGEHARATTRLGWLFFAWQPTGGAAKARRPKRKKPRKRRRAGDVFAAVRAALRSPGFVRRCRRFLSDVLRHAWPRELTAHARVGFDDPADTGMFIGAIRSGAWALPLRPHWDWAVEPDFDQCVFEADLHARWSVRIIALLWPVLTFAVSPAVWRAFRAARRPLKRRD